MKVISDFLTPDKIDILISVLIINSYSYNFIENLSCLIMFEYSVPINFIRKISKKILILCVIFLVIYFIHCEIEISKLSKLKDITDSKRFELLKEIKSLPFTEGTEDFWKEPDIKDSSIYSAYLETRSQVIIEENKNLIYNNSTWAFIRIIGIIPVDLKLPLTCYYEYKYSSKPLEKFLIKKGSLKTQLIAEPENFDMRYSAAFILCPLAYPEELNSQDIRLPYRVTVSTRADRTLDKINSNEFVVIRYPKKFNQPNIDINFAVCVKPFHHNFEKTLDLITFIEFYRMMGVNRFTFYRDSVAENVDKILKFYSEQKVATILEWKLPEIYIFQRNLRTDGIFAALNDCLYRSTFYGAKYVINVDVDEYIVPRINQNYSEMMEELDAENERRTGAWIFRNVFYYLLYEDDAVTLPEGAPRISLHYKTTRWKQANPVFDRSKYFAKGEHVIELGNHRVWRTLKILSIFGTRYRQVEVDPVIATSNHYRLCETEIDECLKRETILDRSTHKFTKELSDRVTKILRQLKL